MRLTDLVWVPQGCRLFNASIRKYLALGEQLPDAELWRALAIVGMEQKVRNLPNQLEELVGEGGAVSRGRRGSGVSGWGLMGVFRCVRA